MQSGKNVFTIALAGAALGAIIGVALAYLDYSFFFRGGVHGMGEQMIPIYVLAVLIGGMLGALAGASWALSSGPGEPPSLR